MIASRIGLGEDNHPLNVNSKGWLTRSQFLARQLLNLLRKQGQPASVTDTTQLAHQPPTQYRKTPQIQTPQIQNYRKSKNVFEEVGSLKTYTK